jgi:hypothetical protein
MGIYSDKVIKPEQMDYQLPANLHESVSDCMPELTSEEIEPERGSGRVREKLYGDLYQTTRNGTDMDVKVAQRNIVLRLLVLNKLTFVQAQDPTHLKVLCCNTEFPSNQKYTRLLKWRSRCSAGDGREWEIITTKQEFELMLTSYACSLLGAAIKCMHQKKVSKTRIWKEDQVLDTAADLFNFRAMGADSIRQSEFSPALPWYSQKSACMFMCHFTLAVKCIKKIYSEQLTGSFFSGAVKTTNMAVRHIEAAEHFFHSEAPLVDECLIQLNHVANAELVHLKHLQLVFCATNFMLHNVPKPTAEQEWEATRLMHNTHTVATGHTKTIILACIQFLKTNHAWVSYAGTWPALIAENLYNTVRVLPRMLQSIPVETVTAHPAWLVTMLSDKKDAWIQGPSDIQSIQTMLQVYTTAKE